MVLEEKMWQEDIAGFLAKRAFVQRLFDTGKVDGVHATLEIKEAALQAEFPTQEVGLIKPNQA